MLKAPALKAQDVLVVCKLFSLGDEDWTYAGLAASVGVSVGEVHDALKRCRLAQLVIGARDTERVSKRHLFDLLVFAVPRIFYSVRGGLDNGWVTAHHLPALQEEFDGLRSGANKIAIPIVWPDLKGPVRGETLLPIYPTVVEATKRDALLHELLALADVVRIGDVRYKKKAVELLEKKILGKAVE